MRRGWPAGRVSEIDWSLLEHAYGSAERVPSWLAAMTDPETGAGALDDLDTAVYHQAACSETPNRLPARLSQLGRVRVAPGNGGRRSRREPPDAAH